MPVYVQLGQKVKMQGSYVESLQDKQKHKSILNNKNKCTTIIRSIKIQSIHLECLVISEFDFVSIGNHRCGPQTDSENGDFVQMEPFSRLVVAGPDVAGQLILEKQELNSRNYFYNKLNHGNH